MKGFLRNVCGLPQPRGEDLKHPQAIIAHKHTYIHIFCKYIYIYIYIDIYICYPPQLSTVSCLSNMNDGAVC